MHQKNILFFFITTFIFLISACESTENARKSARPSARTTNQFVQVANAWTAPTTLAEWTTKEHLSTADLAMIPNVEQGIMAAWTNADSQAQFVTHRLMGGPWERIGPALAGLKTVFSPHLYTNAQSTVAFATWYSPDLPIGANFISRYTPQLGWTTPRAFSNTTGETKVIVGPRGEAVILWLNSAENGSLALNARRFDSLGNLALLDTYILGQPGRLNYDLRLINGWITETGDVEIYGVKWHYTFGDQAFQLWNIRYVQSGSLRKTWSQLQIVPNSQFRVNGFLQGVDVVPVEHGDLRILVNGTTPGLPILIMESKSGIWSNLTPRDLLVGSVGNVSNIASNSQGQLAFAWIQTVDTWSPTRELLVETRVMVAQYSSMFGWALPVQINRSAPLLASFSSSGPDDAPKVKMNSSGQIVVTWINPADKTVSLFSNFFDPVTLWRGEALAVATSFTSRELRRHDVVLTENGDASIVWQVSKYGPGGLTTVSLLAVDHVGSGNGVSNFKSAPQNEISSSVEFPTEYYTNARPHISAGATSPTPQQRMTGILAARIVQPVNVNSAWDEPTLVGIVDTPNSWGFVPDTLRLVTSDQGDAMVSFLVNPKSSTPLLWTGKVVGGGWRKEMSPFLNVGGWSLFRDMVVDPKSGDFYVAWISGCQNQWCSELSLSHKSRDGNWAVPTVLGSGIGMSLDLLVNSTGVGATWYLSLDAMENPQIAYVEHNAVSGWSVPDLFSPATAKGALNTRTHRGVTVLGAAVLGESGVASMLAHLTNSANNVESVLIQRDAVLGWRQYAFPARLDTFFSTETFLNATGASDAVQAIVTEDKNKVSPHEFSYEFSNGIWSDKQEITLPQKGPILSGPGFSKDRNTKGQVLVAWGEQIVSGFNMSRQVRVNWYDPILGWGKPVDIGFPLPADDAWDPLPYPTLNVSNSIQVSINDSGQGSVAWVDASGPAQALNVVHLDSKMAQVEHEIVLSLGSANTRFSELKLNVDNLGRTILVWDETSRGITIDTHRIKSTTHHAGGSNSPQPVIPPVMSYPQIPTAPKQSSGWSDTEIATTFQDPRGWDFLTHKTAIAVPNNVPMLASQVDRAFDWVSERFPASERYLVASTAQGVWDSQMPFGAASPDATTSVQLVTEESTQSLYALWTSQNKLFVSHQAPTGVWNGPLLVTSDSSKGYMLANGRGQVAVVWETISDQSSLHVTELALDTTGRVKIVGTKISTLAFSTRLGDPVFSSRGAIVAMRAVSGSSNSTFVISQYDFGKGWQAQTASTLDLGLFLPSSLQVAISKDNQVVAFAQSDTLRTLHSVLLRADGTWSNWIPVQSGSSPNVALAGRYRIGASSTGQLYASWVEELIGADGVPVDNVMFSSSSVIDIAKDILWTAPKLITQIAHPNFDETPLLAVGSDGTAAIIWKQIITPMESEGIMVRKYAPNTGWATEPEIAASFGLYFLDGPTQINAQISSTNMLYIVWETSGNRTLSIPHTISMTRGRI